MPDGDRELFLLDGNSLAYRAFFALPESIATSEGEPTNAIFGFASMLVKLVTDHGVVPTVVAWDAGHSGRKEVYPDYKATRQSRPDLLKLQWPALAPIVEAFGHHNVSLPGYEADDVIGTLAERARAAGIRVTIVTGDRDAFQLLDEAGLVTVLATARGITDVSRYDHRAVLDRYGIPPEKIPDFYGLKGDTSDHIPGVPGIGDKTASDLLQRFGDLETVLASVDEISGAKRKQNLTEHAENARVSRRLATIHRDLPLELDLDEVLTAEPDRSALRDAFRRWELRDPLRRLEQALEERDLDGPAPRGESGLSAGAGAVREVDLAALQALAPELPVVVAVRVPGEAEGRLFDPDTDGAGEEAPLRFAVAVLEPGDVAAAAERAAEKAATAPPTTAAGLEAALRASEEAAAARTGRSPAHADGSGPGGATAAAPASADPDDAPTVREVLVGGCPSAADVVRALGRRPVVAHDAKALDAVPELLAHDTLLAAYLLEPQRRGYPLGELAEDLGLVAADGLEPAVADALAVTRLYAHQRGQLERRGLGALLHDVEQPLVATLRAMEVAGIRLSVERLAEVAERVRAEIADLERRVHALAGHEFVLGSPQQLGQVLFEELGLSRKRRGKTGFSTDARVLQAIRDEHEIVPLIERWRELSTLAKTYLDVLPGLALADPTGDQRIHTTFQQTVAQTGRLSSTDPNLQNVPVRTPLGREIRGCFEAADGLALLSCDYSQVELRILAHVAGEEALARVFREDEDVHTATAMEVFEVPAEDLDAGMRSKAKMVNYGIVYGLTDFGLADRLNVPREEAKAFIDAYLDRFSAVAAFMEHTIAQAREQGYVRTMFGRRRNIPELAARNFQVRSLGERLAVNTVIQGTAADVLKLAMIGVDRGLRDAGVRSRVILSVHDELVVEGPPDEQDDVEEIVRREMLRPWEHDPPLKVSAGRGRTWLEAK